MVIVTAAGMLCGSMSRLRVYQRTRIVAVRDLALALAFFGVGLLLNAPVIYDWMDRRVLRVNNLAFLLAAIATGLAAHFATRLTDVNVARGGIPEVVRTLILVTFAIATTLAYLPRAPKLPDQPLFFETYGLDIRLRPFWLLLMPSLMLAAAYIAIRVLAGNHLRSGAVAVGRLLIGLGLMGCAAFGGLCALQTITGVLVPPTPHLALLCASVSVVALGAAWPALAQQAAGIRRRRALRRCWTELSEVLPSLGHGSRQLNEYRLLIELQDALLCAKSTAATTSPLLLEIAELPRHPVEQLDQAIDDLMSCIQRHQGRMVS